MGTPFLGEIRLMAFNFAPKGWSQCNGQTLPINQNQALFALLGTNYGGNGQTTFALPDLRGRVPQHFGSGFLLGQKGGEENHTLTQSEMPMHIHMLMASQNNADAPQPSLFAQTNNAYVAPTNLVAIRPDTVTNVGGSQAHPNQQPYLVLNYCIALQGIFPSRN